VEGLTFTTKVDMDDETEAFITFHNDFLKRFDKVPNFPSVLAYEATQALFRALSQSSNPVDLTDTLKKIGIMNGLQNSFQWDAYGDIKSPSYINQVQNDRFVRLDSEQ
jgi:branched-chain amino acid transport system substrate-binding protein